MQHTAQVLLKLISIECVEILEHFGTWQVGAHTTVLHNSMQQQGQT
jgi:hypothetical protein